MKRWFHLLKKNWSDALGEKYFTLKYIVNLVVCYSLYIHFTHLLVLNRFAEGSVINDPFQLMFKPRDFSIYIFWKNVIFF